MQVYTAADQVRLNCRSLTVHTVQDIKDFWIKWTEGLCINNIPIFTSKDVFTVFNSFEFKGIVWLQHVVSTTVYMYVYTLCGLDNPLLTQIRQRHRLIIYRPYIMFI